MIFFSLYQPILDISDVGIATRDYNGKVEIERTLDGNWEGSIISKGTRTDYEGIAHFLLDLGFTDVYITPGDIRVQGDVEMHLEYTIEPTDNLSTTQMMHNSNTVIVSGNVRGRAVLDFELRENYSTQTGITSYSATGAISRTDVSKFS